MIGIFDSGVGGLSVFQVVRRELPAEDIVYFADSGFAPYGDRSVAFVEERSRSVMHHLQERGAELIIVACNTATAVAVDQLRQQAAVPITAIEPAVKPAALQTKAGVIGVLATTQTLASRRFAELVATFGVDVEVIAQPCPGLAEEVEQGNIDGSQVESLIRRYAAPIMERGADVIALGCTHYSFLKPAIQKVVGPDVTLIDPATAVARRVRRQLSEANALATHGRDGSDLFLTSGDPLRVERVISKLLGRPVRVHAVKDDRPA